MDENLEFLGEVFDFRIVLVQRSKTNWKRGKVTTLNNLKPGQSARIIDVDLEGVELQRLMDMGFIENTIVKMIRNAPLLDPLDIEVRGYKAAIRRSEAQHIEVEMI